MNCTFEQTGEQAYACKRCGFVARGITTLPIHRECPKSPPCKHLGDELGMVACPSCRGNVMLKVFACAVYLETTKATPIDGVACCAGCNSYEPTEQQ